MANNKEVSINFGPKDTLVIDCISKDDYTNLMLTFNSALASSRLMVNVINGVTYQINPTLVRYFIVKDTDLELEVKDVPTTAAPKPLTDEEIRAKQAEKQPLVAVFDKANQAAKKRLEEQKIAQSEHFSKLQ